MPNNNSFEDPYEAFKASYSSGSNPASGSEPDAYDQFVQAYMADPANQAPKTPEEASPFTDTLKSTGAHILSSVAGQPVEDVGKLTGLEDVEKAGRGVREFAEEVQRDHPSSIQSLGDIVERPWDAVKEAAGNVLPQIPVSLAGAAAGAAAGAKLGASLPLPPQGKAAAAGIGGLAGIFAPSWLQEYTEMRGKQRESGQEDMGKAALTAIPAAGLETVGDVAILGKLIPEPIRKSAVGKLVDTVAGDTLTKTGIPARAAHAGKQLLKGAGIEGGQEYAQTYLEQVGGNQDTSTPEAQAEREVSAALGAIGGGGIRGGISAFDQVQTPPQTEQPPTAETQAPNIAPETQGEAPNIIGSETPSVAPNVSPEIIPETAPETEQPAPEAKPVSPVDPVTEQLNETLDSAPVKGVANAAAKAAVKQNLTPEQQQAATGVPTTVEEEVGNAPEPIVAEEAAKTPESVVAEKAQAPEEVEPTPTYRNFPTETLLNASANTKNPKVKAAIKEELQRRRQERTATPEDATTVLDTTETSSLDGDSTQQLGLRQEDQDTGLGSEGIPPSGQTLGEIQPEAPETPLSQTVNLDEQSQNQASEERPQETTGQIAPDTSPIDAAAQQTEDNKSFVPESLIQEGEYQKADTEFQGIPIAIENAAGSERRGTDKTGREWKQVLADNYGEIQGTNGADGDKVDVFIKPGMSPEEIAKANKVFIVDQIDPETGFYDEAKIIMGYPTMTQAQKAYLSNYEDGWRGIGAITGVPIEKFKAEFLTNPEAMRTPYNKKVKVAPQQQEQAALGVEQPLVETPQASAQTANLESLFNGLDPLLSDAKTRMETKAQIAVNPASDRIKYVEDNFVDWLFELEQSGKVRIKC